MKTDLIVAEIGSTTTVVNAFRGLGEHIEFAGQGQFRTTVAEGDVNIGLKGAVDDLSRKLGEEITWDHFLASSSAAGGLRMTVHGLVHDMTVKAAKEAALGAGANIKLITSGRLRRTDLKKIEDIKPNIILIAGGVDYGERDTAIYNAELIRGMDLKVPVIYAGNIENREEIELIFEGTDTELYVVENVYPRIDELNVEPTRKVIQEVFERNITHAAGMEEIRKMVDGNIIPTPGAVMESSIILREELGDLITADIGGATTDIHSVCEDSDEIRNLMMDPEPLSKRTVEGDLGMYVSRMHTAALLTDRELKSAGFEDRENFMEAVEYLNPIPENDEERRIVSVLARKALSVALKRHCGELIQYFGPSGRKTAARGKDLTAVKSFIGTGGVLTRIPDKRDIIKKALASGNETELMPDKNTDIFIDEDYIMASAGVISLKFPEEAKILLKKSMRIKD